MRGLRRAHHRDACGLTAVDERRGILRTERNETHGCRGFGHRARRHIGPLRSFPLHPAQNALGVRATGGISFDGAHRQKRLLAAVLFERHQCALVCAVLPPHVETCAEHSDRVHVRVAVPAAFCGETHGHVRVLLWLQLREVFRGVHGHLFDLPLHPSDCRVIPERENRYRALSRRRLRLDVRGIYRAPGGTDDLPRQSRAGSAPRFAARHE